MVVVKIPEEKQNISSIKRFQINRSSILKEILIDKGWKEDNDNDNIDFSYFDTYNEKRQRRNAKLMLIPRKITNKMDVKRSMYDIFLKNNLTYFLPKTYTDVKNINPDIFSENKIFFLKHILGTGGRGVYPINKYNKISSIEKYNRMKKKQIT